MHRYMSLTRPEPLMTPLIVNGELVGARLEYHTFGNTTVYHVYRRELTPDELAEAKQFMLRTEG